MEASGAVDRAGGRRELFSEEFLIKRPLLQALSNGSAAAAGAADRRARPRGRRIRRLSPRAARRLSDHDSRARHDPRRHAADRRHHVEPHARAARRAEAALPVLLDRLSRLRQGAADRDGEGAGRARAAGRAGDGVRSGAARRPTCTRPPACPRRSTGSPRSSRSIATELDAATIEQTLGILLKNQEDIQAVRGERISELCSNRGRRDRPDREPILLHNLLHFGRLLHSLGLDVHAGRMLDVASALEHIDIGRRSDFYFTLQIAADSSAAGSRAVRRGVPRVLAPAAG